MLEAGQRLDSDAKAIDENGEIVGDSSLVRERRGGAVSATTLGAFLWSADRGMRDLADLLEDGSVVTYFTEAEAIAENGTVVALTGPTLTLLGRGAGGGDGGGGGTADEDGDGIGDREDCSRVFASSVGPRPGAARALRPAASATRAVWRRHPPRPHRTPARRSPDRRGTPARRASGGSSRRR